MSFRHGSGKVQIMWSCQCLSTIWRLLLDAEKKVCHTECCRLPGRSRRLSFPSMTVSKPTQLTFFALKYILSTAIVVTLAVILVSSHTSPRNVQVCTFLVRIKISPDRFTAKGWSFVLVWWISTQSIWLTGASPRIKPSCWVRSL